MHAPISLDDSQAYTMRVADTCGVSTNGEVAEVIVWRARIHRCLKKSLTHRVQATCHRDVKFTQKSKEKSKNNIFSRGADGSKMI